MAQTALPAIPIAAQAATQDPSGQTPLGYARGTAPANLLSSNREMGTVYDDSKDYLSPSMAREDTPGLDELHSGSEKHNNMAFLNAALQRGSGRKGMRGKVAPIILSLAVHAAVTWDAQSTNHFFHHYPEGYRPTEVDPLMRPFAGKALMYPMANLFFAVPVDLVLFKTRHSQKPIRILTYAAASYWVGLEIHQSIVNIGNEHINSSK
jgi:hypothetical protein